MRAPLDHELKELRERLDRLRELNADDQPTRSRVLSNTITRLEEAIHWLQEAADAAE